MKFRTFKNEAVADVALEAHGQNPSRLFENAALALFEQMADTKAIKPQKTLLVKLSRPDLESLLYSFLSEIVFLKDQKRVLFKKASVTILEKKAKKNSVDARFFLSAKLSGQAIPKILGDAVRIDVKAVTFFGFKVSKTKKNWKAKLVLDL